MTRARDLGEAFRLCPFRTLLGTTDPDRPPNHVFAALGGTPEPIAGETLAELAAALQAGGVVLLLATSRELRDYAKREILLAAAGAAGTA